MHSCCCCCPSCPPSDAHFVWGEKKRKRQKAPDTLGILMVCLKKLKPKEKRSELVLSCGLQLLTQSQRALSNIHTHLSSLDRNALTQFPKAEVQHPIWEEAPLPTKYALCHHASIIRQQISLSVSTHRHKISKYCN